MKKLLSVFLSMVLMLTTSATVFAANGDIVGHIYSTDIRAFINGVEVESYNIGGKTVVVIEDILANSSSCVYSDYYRTLKFFSLNPAILVESKKQDAPTPGKIIGDVYETDIVTSIYDVAIPTYNIGGKTAVAIEDLGHHGEFSPIGGKFLWNEAERTIRLEFLYQNSSILAADKNITITANETMSEANATFQEVLHCGGRAEYFSFPEYVTDDATIETVMPIKADGEIIGYYFRRPSKDYKFTAFTFYYPEKVQEAEKNYTPDPQKTREGVINHFIGGHSMGEPRARFDTEKYSFVYISVAGTSWTSYNLLQVYEDGTYVDYKDSIHMPNRSPNNLEIDRENELVTFRHSDRYHPEWYTDYQINLKTGSIEAVEPKPVTKEDLSYKIHFTDRTEPKEEGDGEFSIVYTQDSIYKTGDAEYFSGSLHSNGEEYYILLDFEDGKYAGKLIDLFGQISSGNQTVPIHNEEEKYDAVNEKVTITINRTTAQQVAVKRVFWKGNTTVYLHVRDIEPIPMDLVQKFSINVK
ncbi:MAG: hypothetical protein J6A61_07210 [Clostridia bacterium]|nr:hypothetical protein [Clostridia bacterium]